MSAYGIALIAAATIIALITNIRICFFLAEKKWKMEPGNGVFMLIVTSIASVVIAIFLGIVAIRVGGEFYGVAFCLGALFLVGFAWCFVVGAIKGVERILLNLVDSFERVEKPAEKTTA